eukprot:Opistho-1_new@34429
MMRPKLIPLVTFLIIGCGANPSSPGKKASTTAATPSGFSGVSAREKAYYANAIAPMYQNLLAKRGFSGGIIMAKNGEIVFEDYRGSVNLRTKEPITANTPFHIASVSKTFTATVILKLLEEGKLSLDDKMEKYFPGFPYANISIKSLLTHRSGLPKYD